MPNGHLHHVLLAGLYFVMNRFRTFTGCYIFLFNRDSITSPFMWLDEVFRWQIGSRKSLFLPLTIRPHDHTKSPKEDVANRTKQMLSDVTSAQQRLKVTANRIAHLLPLFFLVFFEGDGATEKRRTNEREERRKTGQERRAATWQLRAIWFVEAVGAGSQARRPGNVIQGGCLNMTSLGAVQSAAKAWSSALAGMVAAEVTTVSSPPVNPGEGGKKIWWRGRRREEVRSRKMRMEINIVLCPQCGDKTGRLPKINKI